MRLLVGGDTPRPRYNNGQLAAHNRVKRRYLILSEDRIWNGIISIYVNWSPIIHRISKVTLKFTSSVFPLKLEN
jgi:hypothetical protein